MSSPRSIGEIIGFASRAGLPMGVYLTAISACMIGSLYWVSASVIGVILMAGVPVVLWKLLTPLADNSDGRVKAGPIWLAGIYCFIFGSLICGLLSGLYLQFIEPYFVVNYIRKYMETVATLPNPGEFSRQTAMMQEMLDKRMLPTVMELVTSSMWATGFFGSLLSGIEALLISRVRPARLGQYK